MDYFLNPVPNPQRKVLKSHKKGIIPSLCCILQIRNGLSMTTTTRTLPDVAIDIPYFKAILYTCYYHYQNFQFINILPVHKPQIYSVVSLRYSATCLATCLPLIIQRRLEVKLASQEKTNLPGDAKDTPLLTRERLCRETFTVYEFRRCERLCTAASCLFSENFPNT